MTWHWHRLMISNYWCQTIPVSTFQEPRFVYLCYYTDAIVTVSTACFCNNKLKYCHVLSWQLLYRKTLSKFEISLRSIVLTFTTSPFIHSSSHVNIGPTYCGRKLSQFPFLFLYFMLTLLLLHNSQVIFRADRTAPYLHIHVSIHVCIHVCIYHFQFPIQQILKITTTNKSVTYFFFPVYLAIFITWLFERIITNITISYLMNKQ